MKAMAEFIDAQSGGPGSGWLQIAYSPEDARRIIGENKLAVVLGVEVDSLGNWRRVEDLEEACQGDMAQARLLIGLELDWLYALGVRQITPIHLTNNAFGGTAIYMRFLETVNVFVTGERWTVEDAWQTGVRYRLDHDGDDLVDDVERTVAMSGGRRRAMHRHTLVDHIPGVRNLVEAVEAPKMGGGHANVRSLNQYGRILLEEMMKRGMIIDVDHMSEKSTDAALDLAEAHQYPVITSHSWFRDLLYSSPDEFNPQKEEATARAMCTRWPMKPASAATRSSASPAWAGSSPRSSTRAISPGCARACQSWPAKSRAPALAPARPGPRLTSTPWPRPAEGALPWAPTSTAQPVCPGRALGPLPPMGRATTPAASLERRAEIDSQTNGVAYSEPIRDYRWHRFEPSGPGGYDEESCDIWHAIAQYAAGFNPALHDHPHSDFPELNIQQLLEAADLYLDQDWIDHITLGFWMADQPEPP